MMKRYGFNLPRGAVLKIVTADGAEIELIHQGSGSFVTSTPVWVIEGITEDGGVADREWKPAFELLEFPCRDPRPSHRRVAAGEVVQPQSDAEIDREIEEADFYAAGG